jgi:hypothetical protein
VCIVELSRKQANGGLILSLNTWLDMNAHVTLRKCKAVQIKTCVRNLGGY